jgi:hypothetical protein
VLPQPFAAGGVLAGNLWGQVLERLTGLVNLQLPAGTFDPGAGIGMPVTQPSKPSR